MELDKQDGIELLAKAISSYIGYYIPTLCSITPISVPKKGVIAFQFRGSPVGKNKRIWFEMSLHKKIFQIKKVFAKRFPEACTILVKIMYAIDYKEI